MRSIDLQLTLSSESANPSKANAIPDSSAALYLPPKLSKLCALADRDALFPVKPDEPAGGGGEGMGKRVPQDALNQWHRRKAV